MEINKVYIDHRSVVSGSKIAPATITCKFDTGKYFYLYTSRGRKGVDTHLNRLKGKYKNVAVRNEYAKAKTLTLEIELYDSEIEATDRVARLRETDDHNCLNGEWRPTSDYPTGPCAYTIHIGGKFYHGSTGKMNRRAMSHKHHLKAGKHINRGMQYLYDSDHRPTFKIYKCRTLEEARELEDKMIKDDAGNPKMLNIIQTAYVGEHSAIECEWDGVTYRSMKEASRQSGVPFSTLRRHVLGHR